VDFLERLSDRDRDRFLAASTTVRLARGDYLIRRGERGGDVYRVVDGELEVIDGRQQPAVVLDVIGRGQMVGEMGFLQEQVRTADVRAGETTVCQRWDRGSLLKVLDADPPFAAAFYRALAGLAVDRSRTITTTAMMGALAGGKGAGSETIREQARAIAGRVRTALSEIEPLIRRDRAAAQQRVVTVLHNCQNELESTFSRLGRAEQLAAGAEVARELNPYVMRSHLGEMANDRVEGWAGDSWAIAHIAAHKPLGDGPLGEMIDGWLLDLPTSRALRERRALAAQLVTECLPATPPVRILCIGANSGSLLASELEPIGRLGGEIVCVESVREALTVVDSDLQARPRTVKLRLVQDDLAALCNGEAHVRYPPQNIVVIDGILEYLPERVMVTLVRAAVNCLAPEGRLVVTAISPAPDEMVFRHLLAWPMIRRSAATLRGLLSAGGLSDLRIYEAGSAGLAGVGVRALV
jgi:CRP-like cAMP-binding protein